MRVYTVCTKTWKIQLSIYCNFATTRNEDARRKMKQQGQRAASAGQQPAALALAKCWAFTFFVYEYKAQFCSKFKNKFRTMPATAAKKKKKEEQPKKNKFQIKKEATFYTILTTLAGA